MNAKITNIHDSHIDDLFRKIKKCDAVTFLLDREER